MKRIVWMLLIAGIAFWAPFSYGETGKGSASPSPLRFGTLGVLQALPLFVAAEKGYFRDQGIEVELIPFNSAMEKDVALSAGQISGYFGDIMTPIVLTGNKTPIRMVATIYNTTGPQRMFAIMTPPGTPPRTLVELNGPPRVMTKTRSNALSDWITARAVTTIVTGLSNGNVI